MVVKTPAFQTALHSDQCFVLNAVEGWFAQLERRALYRGVFTSVAELKNRYSSIYRAPQ
jgi:hypothetical protein